MAGKKTTFRERVIKKRVKALQTLVDAMDGKLKVTTVGVAAARYIIDVALRNEEAIKQKVLSYEEQIKELKEGEGAVNEEGD